MKKYLPLFRRIALFCCILTSSVACEKFDDTNPFDYNPLPKPLPNTVLYTTLDGDPVDVSNWGSTVLEHCYEDGIGQITLREDVTFVPYKAFYDCSTLLDVALPETITVIGVSAFENSRLRSIVIPDSVVSLREWAFYNCNDLVRIVIPDSVTYMGESVFSSCSNLSEVKLSNNLTEIPPYTFCYCASLKKVNIPDSVTKIGNGAFTECFSLEKIVLPSGIQDLLYAFYNCASLKEVVFGEGLKNVGSFTGCTSLKTLTLPEGVETIDDYAFAYCEALERIDIPSTVQIIGNHAFENCKRLKHINLPEGLEYINNDLFANCYGLSEIQIPESVTTIFSGAFQDTKITHIHIPDNVINIHTAAFIYTGNLQSFSGKFVTDDGRCVITDDNILNGFASKGLTSYEFSEGIREIADFAAPNYDIESLTLPSSIESISRSIGISLHSFLHLKALYCKATTPPYFHFDVRSDEQPSITVYVPRASVEAYKQSSSWGIFNIEGYDF